MVNLVNLLAGILLILVSAVPALAENSENTALEPTIVTARKTAEDLQTVPASVSVFSGNLLEDAGIETTQDLVRYAPNVYMKKSTSENMISIRGVTPFDSSIYSPTAFYVDDILLPLHYMHNLDFFDLERVEILRGPQGSLYGGNSESGVVKVVTRRPTNHFRGEVMAETGVYLTTDKDPWRTKTGINLSGPIRKDILFLGVSGLVEHDQGVTTNLNTGEDRGSDMERYNGRVSLRAEPSDRLSISLVGDAMKNNDHIAVYRFGTGPYRTDPYTVRHEETDWSREEGNGQAMKLTYKGNSLEFLSVTGHRRYTNVNQQDYDCTADPLNNWGETVGDYDDRIITQEFRLSSDQKGPFTWLSGFYAFTEETRIRQDNAISSNHRVTDIDTEGAALFGMATYTFFDRFHLGAGLRYDAQFQEGSHTRNLTDYLAKDQEFKEVLPKFSIGFDLTPEIYTYALVSKGFLAGGYNYAMAVDTQSLTYGSEYVWNHEIGVKASWLNNRLVTNVALFYLDMSDKQVYEQVTGSNPGTRIDNAAEAHTKGVELEITARPARGLDIQAGLGLISGEYDQWVATEWNPSYTGYVTRDYSGKTLPNVPEYTFNLGGQYRFKTGFFIRADVNGVGAFYGDHGNTVKEGAYALTNLKLGYETDRFDVYLWGRNIFDTHYHSIKYDWDGEELVQDGDPLSVGLSLCWRF